MIINERKILNNKDDKIQKIYLTSIGKYNRKITNNNILKIKHNFSMT